MTRPDTPTPRIPDRNAPEVAAPTHRGITEEQDQAHYYFAEWTTRTERGDTIHEPVLFPSVPGAEWVDMRDADGSGVAFVRAPALLTDLPTEVFYVGQSLLAPLPVEQRRTARLRLGLRGEITTVKDILRYLLLTEAGEKGRPGRLAPEAHGALYVYLGDLRIDLAR